MVRTGTSSSRAAFLSKFDHETWQHVSSLLYFPKRYTQLNLNSDILKLYGVGWWLLRPWWGSIGALHGPTGSLIWLLPNIGTKVRRRKQLSGTPYAFQGTAILRGQVFETISQKDAYLRLSVFIKVHIQYGCCRRRCSLCKDRDVSVTSALVRFWNSFFIGATTALFFRPVGQIVSVDPSLLSC